jgi:hypothetical protein
MFKNKSPANNLSRLLMYNLIFSSPLIFNQSTSDGYIFIKYIFLAINILILASFESINVWKFKFFTSAPYIVFITAFFLSCIKVVNFYSYFIALFFVFSSLFILNYISSAFEIKSSLVAIILILSSSTIVSIYGILEYINIGSIGPFIFKTSVDSYNLPMQPSTLGHDNYAGEFISTALPFFLTFLMISIRKKNIKITIAFIISLILNLYYLVITQARGAWIAFIFSTIILIAFSMTCFNKKDILKFLITILIFTIVIGFSANILFSGKIDSFKKKFLSIFDLQDNPIKFRLYLWKSTLSMIKNYFPLGIGPGNFKYIYPLFRSNDEIVVSGKEILVRDVHNDFLQFALEYGPLGLFSVFWFILASYKALLTIARKKLIKKNYTCFFILTGSLGSITANIIQANFGFSLQNPVTLIMFIVAVGFIFSQFKGENIG